MKKLAALAVIPLFGVFLCARAQEPRREVQTTTTTTTTSNMFDGTLVDASCQSKHIETTETTNSRPDENTTRTQTTKTTTHKVDCPVTTTTTSFGLMTPEGQYVAFDEPSNSKIVEVVKTHKDWDRYISNREPLKVKVKGHRNGNVIVFESIQ